MGGTTKIAGEYIYYRKVGDHATNMPSCLYFGNRKNGKYVISDNVKYEYDKNGNICKIYENGALTARYTYDALDRLVREDNKTFGKTYLYAYDNCGNILSRRETNFTLKEDVEECTFTSVQYAYEGDRLVSVGDETCAYDEIGNPTTYRGKAVTWANGRQMTKFNTTAFAYDGQGRRRSKGSISFTYYKDGRVVKQSNGLEFIYDQSGIAGKKNNATYFYRKDAQGNIAAILDGNGNIVVEYKYDSWGNHAVLDANGADIASATHIGNLNPFRYRGYYYDTETGLYFLKTRYYDPEVGRFITIDSISYIDPETINGLNLYAYCGNNPVMRVDENGNAWWEWLVGALVVIAVTVAVVATAGAAAVALGASSAMIFAVTSGAALGGLVAGGCELVGQGIQNNWQHLDLGALAIETFTGAAYGVISGVSGTTLSAGVRVAMRAARVGLSALNTMLMGIHNGDSASTIVSSTLTSLLKGIIVQGAMLGLDHLSGYTSTANIMAMALDKDIMYGVKEKLVTMAILAGKSIWKFHGQDIIDILSRIGNFLG